MVRKQMARAAARPVGRSAMHPSRIDLPKGRRVHVMVDICRADEQQHYKFRRYPGTLNAADFRIETGFKIGKMRFKPVP